MNNKAKTSGSSKGQKLKAKKKVPPSTKKPSVLVALRNTSDCNCEVVARAVRSNVHKNLSLNDKRVELGKDKEE